MAKRPVLPIEQLSDESQQMFDVLNNDSDLEVVLVATSFLDACLGSILNRKLIDSKVSKKLLEPSGALGNYSARTDVCYALGLIQKPLYKDLQKIAEIRNEIAHYHQALSFESDAIRKLCSELSYVTTSKNGNTSDPLFRPELVFHPRNRFVITTVMINQRLLIIGLELNNSQKA